MQTRINRRTFFKNTALTGTGLFLAPSLAQALNTFAPGYQGKISPMAGLLPISIIDNACLLAFRTNTLSRPSREAATADLHVKLAGNKGRLAVVLPPENNKLIELLEILKNSEELNRRNEKLAIAFGWAGVNAVHRHVSPGMDKLEKNAFIETRVQQDAQLLKEFSKPEHDPGQASAQEMENLLKAMVPRAITRVHTLKPDVDDGIGWVNRMSAWRRDNTILMKRYAQALVQDINEKASKEFLSMEDKLVLYARNLQKNIDVNATKILEEIENGQANSLYGKTLQETTANILAMNKYMEGALSSAEISSKLGF